MFQDITPISCRPWALNGISKDLVVSHYENVYGAAVRTLNAVRRELAVLPLDAPDYRVRAFKREELLSMGSVVLHELYFGNLGGDGKMVDAARRELEESFGSVDAWRRGFIMAARSLTGGHGWVLLTYSRRHQQLWNQVGLDYAEAAVDCTPVLALDMYGHAYEAEFGANVTAYIDAFMRNIDWSVVADRIAMARGNRAWSPEDPSDKDLPSMSVEELDARVSQGEAVQVIDVRPRHYISRATDMMGGATWRDPDRVDEWIAELAADKPVAVYCAYGFHVGCSVTKMLRERGFEARYLRGGLSAWYAAGGARAPRLAGP